jgi:hypothetical protein
MSRMQTLESGTDLMVRDGQGTPIALVEIKNLPDLSVDGASAVLRNLLTHGLAKPPARFLLIVSQETGYLWDQEDWDVSTGGQPAAAFRMGDVVNRYLPSLAGNRRLSHSQLELAVSQWLWDLANGSEDRPIEIESELDQTAFLDHIRGGRVTTLAGR